MYANLTVTTSQGKELCAWQVEIDPAKGTTRVYLDDPDDESSYPVTRGTLELRGPCSIRANF